MTSKPPGQGSYTIGAPNRVVQRIHGHSYPLPLEQDPEAQDDPRWHTRPKQRSVPLQKQTWKYSISQTRRAQNSQLFNLAKVEPSLFFQAPGTEKYCRQHHLDVQEQRCTTIINILIILHSLLSDDLSQHSANNNKGRRYLVTLCLPPPTLTPWIRRIHD